MRLDLATRPALMDRRTALARASMGAWGIVFGLRLHRATAQPAESPPAESPQKDPIDRAILSSGEWRDIELAVDRGLKWMASQQQRAGGFGISEGHEPGVTGLCVLALLSRGHLPGHGPYGKTLEAGSRFILSCQRSNGLLSRVPISQSANYNHGIGSLALSELYGLARPTDDERFQQVLEKCLRFASRRLSQPKLYPVDEGGWRYLQRHAVSDSDLSITSWHLMFLRSAKNAGFEVDGRLIEEALGYVRRVFDDDFGTFRYEIHTDDPQYNHTRAMAGAGILSLAMAGDHHSRLARLAAESLLKRPFTGYDHPVSGERYQCYSAFYCSQAMFHMGGEFWKQFYPQLATTLLTAQLDNGAWCPESGDDLLYGMPYITALTVLALAAPFQVLPIFQR